MINGLPPVVGQQVFDLSQDLKPQPETSFPTDLIAKISREDSNGLEVSSGLRGEDIQVEAEKEAIAKKGDDPKGSGDEFVNNIGDQIFKVAEKTVVFNIFWGSVKKTQTDFKQMSHGQ